MRTIRDVEKILKALANRRRLLILKYISKVGRANVSTIAKEIKLSLKATSKHLRVLSAIGIVENEQTGLMVEYYCKGSLHQITKSSLDSF